jgi:hypothetical protein
MESDWTPADVNGLIGNPYRAINIDPVLAKPHQLLISEEQWIAAKVKQSQDLGPEAYLRGAYRLGSVLLTRQPSGHDGDPQIRGLDSHRSDPSARAGRESSRLRFRPAVPFIAS